MTARFLGLLATTVALAWFWGAAGPVRADRQPVPAIDEELLKSLGADPLDEFDRELFAPGDRKRGDADSGAEPPQSTGQADDELQLLDIARQMRAVEGLISRTESGPKTQDMQKEIVAELEELIKRACKKCRGGRPSQSQRKVAARQPVPQPKKKPGSKPGSPQPKPATQSNAKPGKAEPQRPDMDEMRELIKAVWGELPETQRQQMLELIGEEFLPKYELLIQQYFKRLAEEREAARAEP